MNFIQQLFKQSRSSLSNIKQAIQKLSMEHKLLIKKFSKFDAEKNFFVNKMRVFAICTFASTQWVQQIYDGYCPID